MSLTYTTDDDGNNAGITGDLTAYSSGCGWVPPDDTPYEADLINDRATFGGVLFGMGSCDGIQFVYENVWDDNTAKIVTTGVLERIY